MLQKEVAERLTARPGDEQYGYLTLYAQLFARARILMTLEPGSFHPRPNVRSAVVVLDPDRKPFASPELLDLISAAFRMRRKKLVNNLTTFGRADLTGAMERLGINPDARAEEMALEDFAKLAAALGTG